MSLLQNKSILIVDDDINLCKSVKYGLISEGANVDVATDGRACIQKFEKNEFDLILLDIRMPEVDGWETAKYLRMLSNIPIIMLTSLKTDEDMIKGLGLGADDYVTKPFNPEVLLARISSVMRRQNTNNGLSNQFEKESSMSEFFFDGYLTIDLIQRQVFVKDKEVKLSTTEFDLLSYLVKNANRCVTYTELLENIWGKAYQNEAEYIRVYISFLRRKIEPDSKNPKYLLNEYRRGYRFAFKPNTNSSDAEG
ncbi:MAG: response regulator transcription factor [Chloroflexota bacterium]